MKRLRRGLIPLLSSAALLIACGPGLAQKKDEKAKAPEPQQASAWAVSCSDVQKTFQCEMTQVLLDQATRRQLMLISIKNSSTGDAKVMLVRVIHGVYLPSGVSIAVDKGKPNALAFQKSDSAGVYAALPLTDKLVDEMKKGTELGFSMELEQGKPIQMVARLFGFGPAFERLSSVR